MIDTSLLTQSVAVSAKGDGPCIDVSPASGRVLLATLQITRIIEQESLDVTIFGSSDGTTWGAKPLVTFPQKFYCGETPMLLDLTANPDVKFVRAHWEVARWGRGDETPMFEFDIRLKEIPDDLLRRLATESIPTRA